jgi:nucleotide-binding universal stress UspA family protein
MISDILVPTDGSKAAQKAARYAIDLAKQLRQKFRFWWSGDDSRGFWASVKNN